MKNEIDKDKLYDVFCQLTKEQRENLIQMAKLFADENKNNKNDEAFENKNDCKDV